MMGIKMKDHSHWLSYVTKLQAKAKPKDRKLKENTRIARKEDKSSLKN